MTDYNGRQQDYIVYYILLIPNPIHVDTYELESDENILFLPLNANQWIGRGLQTTT